MGEGGVTVKTERLMVRGQRCRTKGRLRTRQLYSFGDADKTGSGLISAWQKDE